MPEKTETESVEIFEHPCTWGCGWRPVGGDDHFGFTAFKPRTRLWLQCAGGDAVRQLIAAGLGEVIRVERGAYGGQRRTVRVPVAMLDDACDAYWERVNARDAARQELQRVCHYCGQPATTTGFFEVPVCAECGG